MWLFNALLQSLRTEKAAVHRWTQKLSADSELQVERNRLLRHNNVHSRNWDIIQLENISHSVMPLERRMPAAEAELNFHGYCMCELITLYLYYYSVI